MYLSDRQKIINVLGTDDRLIMLVCLPVIAFAIPLLFFNGTLEEGLTNYLPHFLTSLMYSIVFWLSVRYIMIRFRLRFPRYNQTARRIVYSVLVFIPVYLLIASSLDYVHRDLLGLSDPAGVTQKDYNVASIMTIIMIAAIYESIFMYARWKETLIEQEKLRREYIESQLEGLRTQVNPHFLFNSLNTLIYIIPENPQKAMDFVRKLSKVYRYILEIRDRRLITIREELEFLESFLFLVKERFGENIRVDVNVPEAFHAHQVLPLSLQMLMENAIKHNVISQSRPLDIAVYIDDNLLVVRNTYQPKTQVQESTKVGLENIRHRYSFFTNQEVVIEQTSGHFLVGLPMLKASKDLQPIEPKAATGA